MNDKPKDLNDLAQAGELPKDPLDIAGPEENPPALPGDAGTDESTKARVQPVAEVFDAALEHLKARGAGRERPVATPWPELNDHLGGGFWPGELIPVVGNTGSGKTQWALQIAWHAARKGRPVYYVALESDPMEMVSRLMALEYAECENKRVDWSDLYHGKNTDLTIIAESTTNRLRELPLSFIFGEPLVWSPGDLDSLLRQHEGQSKHPLVVVDFLQLIGGGRVDIRERISAGSYQLRHLARTYGATILVLSATARKNYDLFDGSRPNFGLGKSPTEPLQGSGKESGEIEYAAATVVALCREPWKGKEPPDVHLAVVKARAGKQGWIGPLGFDGTGYTKQAPTKTTGGVHGIK